MADYRGYSLLVYQKKQRIEKHFLFLSSFFLKTSYSNGIIVKRVIFLQQMKERVRWMYLQIF